VTATFCHQLARDWKPDPGQAALFFWTVATTQRRGDLRVAQSHTHARHSVGDLLHLSDQLLDAAEHQAEILSELILPADAAL
jgi:hypothetical protein